MNGKIKVLIGSPIRQEYEILYYFLNSLKEIIKDDIVIEYFFIDDNDDEKSSNLLNKFSKECNGNVIIQQGEKIGQYQKTEDTHYWKDNLIWKIAEYKNSIIEYSKKENFDYLFLVDSDIVLHPKTIIHLIGTEKEIISEIFWTKWKKESAELPQVWVYDEYSLIPKKSYEVLTQKESDSRYKSFLEQLRIPGIYEVGGLGACTLISKKALNKGVNFNKIYNLSFWGEDRHFCIRAAALGLKLYVDTNYPAYHIYRKEDIKGVEAYKNKCIEQASDTNKNNFTKTNTFPLKRISKDKDNKLTLAMLVRNESGKFLEEVLTHAAQYIDNAVILDDDSEDNTIEICKDILKNIPLTLISNKEHGFKNEIALRKQLWEITTGMNPDWIISLDADEIFEDKIIDLIPLLINQPNFDYYTFRLYDMWDSTHYREDRHWNSHKYYRPFLVRYQPNFNYRWKEAPLHCGRVPENIFNMNGCICYIRLKHLGWSTDKLREEKYKRYLELDPEGKYGILEQYESILDINPTLIKW